MRLHTALFSVLGVLLFFFVPVTYTTENVLLGWKSDNAVTLDPDFELPQFELEKKVRLFDCTNRTPGDIHFNSATSLLLFDFLPCLNASIASTHNTGVVSIRIFA